MGPKPAQMSDKQMGRAAHDRRMIRFVIFENTMPTDGYLVGMDNFHWLVAVPGNTNKESYATLIHKSCPQVVFLSRHLEREDNDAKKFIREIGTPFWLHCQKAYVGHSAPKDEETAK